MVDSMKYDLAIATSTYFAIYGNVPYSGYRLKLFRELMDSMKDVRWCGLKPIWVIHDDNSPHFPATPDAEIDTLVFHRNTNLGQPKNYLSTVNHACEMAPWVLVVDDDGIISPDCIERLLWLKDKFPEREVFCAFNSPYHAVSIDGDGYVEKLTCPEHGRFFTAANGGFRSVSHTIATLKPSGVQHCGKYGLNGTANDWDRDFRISTESELRPTATCV